MADRVVRIVLTGDSSGAVRAMKQVEDTSSGTTSKLEEHGKRQTAVFERVHGGVDRLHTGLGLLAGSVGLGALAYGFANATKAGITLQDQQAQLQAAFKSTGNFSAQAMGQMVANANSLATRGGFATQENLQTLTQFTRITGSATAATNLLALATNVARGSHKDLLQVTKALALAEQGRTIGLSRLGIVLPKGASPQEAMATLQQRYGGATAAFSSTAAGAMSNLGQGWDIIKEDLGKAFMPLVSTFAHVLTGAMPQISRLLNAVAGPLAKTLQKLLPPLLSGLQTLLPPILSVIQTVLPPILRAVDSVLPVLAGALRTLMPVFQKALDVILPPLVHLFNVLVPVITKALSQILPPLVRIFQTVLPVMVRAFQLIAPPLMQALSTVVTALAPVIGRMVQSLTPIIPVLTQAIVRLMPPLAQAILTLMPPLTTALASLLPPFVSAFNKLVPPLTSALLALMPAIRLFASAVQTASNFLTKPYHPFGGHGTLADIGNFIFNPFGRFNPSPPQHHAQGGIISGYGGSDSVLSWMTPGEGVVTPRGMQRIGGEAGLNAINASGSSPAGAGNTHFVVDAPIQVTLANSRILAEESVRFTMRKVALS